YDSGLGVPKWADHAGMRCTGIGMPSCGAEVGEDTHVTTYRSDDREDDLSASGTTPQTAPTSPEPDAPARPRGVVAAADAGVASAVQAAEHARAQFTEVVRTPEITRRLALLWDPPAPATRGRKPRLTLDDVVRAGIAVAQEGGLEIGRASCRERE